MRRICQQQIEKTRIELWVLNMTQIHVQKVLEGRVDPLLTYSLINLVKQGLGLQS